MKIIFPAILAAVFAAPASAQCPNGVCNVGPVARGVRYVASVPGRLVAPQVVPVPMTPANVAKPPTIANAGGKPVTARTVAAAKIVAPKRA